MLNKINIIFGENAMKNIMKKLYLILILLSFTTVTTAQEVIYEIDNFDFFGSENDTEQLNQRLKYLTKLGVTSVVLPPIHKYHNNYPSDFTSVNKAFDSWDYYKHLLETIHMYRIKVYQDIQLSYVSDAHNWFVSSVNQPKSDYADYILYSDKENKVPVFFKNIKDKIVKDAVMVNLNNPKVLSYYTDILSILLDINGDSTGTDYVDGFRILDIDNENTVFGKKREQLEKFWRPLIASVKAVNPVTSFLVLHRNTDSEIQWLTVAGADRIYATGVQESLVTLENYKIDLVVNNIFEATPENKSQVIYLSSNDNKQGDNKRKNNTGKKKVSAALNLLIGGIPSVHQGEENNESTKKYITDVFTTNQENTDALPDFYKQMIKLRRQQPAIALGEYITVPNRSKNVISFLRQQGNQKVLIIINLSESKEPVTLLDNSFPVQKLQLLYGSANYTFPRGGRTIVLPPYWVQVWRVL